MHVTPALRLARPSRSRRCRSALLALAAAVFAHAAVAGWGSKSEKELIKEADAFIKNKPEPLKQFFHTLYMEGEWNAVLNLNLLALAALEVTRHDIAEKALDQSTARILRIYADDPNAAKAKSLWSAEGVKDFKGEPYERAMAFYYRGLLYLREGDFQNARAAFLQSDLQNAMGQTEKYDRSFALPTYLAAWASACDGDAQRADELLAAMQKYAIDPYFKLAHPSFPRHITLFDRGIGPEKVTLGDAKNILSFFPQPDVSQGVQVNYARPPAEAARQGVAANLDWLALTRGGRPIQGLLDGKVQFKETTAALSDISSSVASAALYGSLSTLGSDKLSVAKNLGMLGAGASLIGSFASLASRSTKTEADTRYWGSLPKYVFIEAYGAEMGLEPKAFVTTATKKPRPALIAATHADKCSFAYGREFSALDATQGGIGNPSPWPAEPMEDDRDKPNEAFRLFLRASF